MQAKVHNQAPPALVVLAVFLFLFALLGRESFVLEDFPAFLSLNDNFLYVELTGTAVSAGVYQINDGLALSGVIDLTHGVSMKDLSTGPAWSRPLQNGESIEIIKKDQRIELLQRGWMPASHRVSMGIPLHPDRMSSADWQFLPGIGEVLARTVEEDRQKNGDFVSLEDLKRVKGIGLKSVDRWRVFFSAM